MLVAVIAAPGLLGSQEAIRQSQSKEKREEHRARRCNLIATCIKSSARSREVNGRPIVLKDGKLWIDAGTKDGAPLGHPYAGYYLPYPDSAHEGLVTTITDVAPIMNWVYVDKDTYEVKYGVRVDAQPNLTGPFDCTRQDRRLTFDGWEGWCAVEEQPGSWALYFDVEDNGLKSKVAPGTIVLEIELSRKEKRFQKEAGARQQDQTTKRAVDVNQDAPVDEALAPEALVSKPGVRDEGTGGEVKEATPKAFMMPKSIFENPPAMLAESIFERPPMPRTPPPAYETNERPPPLNIPVVVKDKSDPVSVLVSPMRSGFSISVKSPTRRSMSPTAARQETAANEKGATPVKRSSGTRTLAKAQMFEALAAGQKPSVDVEKAGGKRGSRASSIADSVSVYSGDAQDVTESTRILPHASPTPPPLVPAALETQVPPRRAELSKVPVWIDRSAMPRQRAFTDSMDPAVFGAGPPLSARRRGPIRRPSVMENLPVRKPSTSLGSSQASSATADSAARKPSTSSSPSQQISRPPLQRRGTAPEKQANTPFSAAFRTQSQANRGAAPTSLVATMTTGRGNRGMTTRVGGTGAAGRARLERSNPVQGGMRMGVARKTTSALFREIDELVNQDVSSGDARSRGDVGKVETKGSVGRRT